MSTFDGYTTAVCHFNNNFTDEIGHTLVNSGFSLSATQSVFGGYSLYLDGDGHIEFPTDFKLSVGDYTVEFRIYNTSSDRRCLFMSSAEYTGDGWNRHELLYKQSTSELFIRHITSQGISSTQIISSIPMSLNAWHAVAFEKYGANYLIFVDGVLVQTVAVSKSIFDSPTIYLGNRVSETDTDPPVGYIDELRISKGIARYISGYTVATVPFGDETPPPSFPTATANYKLNPSIWMKESPLTVSENDAFYVSDTIIGGVEITDLDCHIYLGNTDKSFECFVGNEQSYSDNRYTTNKIQNLKGNNIYVLSARVTIDGQVKTRKCEIHVIKESKYA